MKQFSIVRASSSTPLEMATATSVLTLEDLGKGVVVSNGWVYRAAHLNLLFSLSRSKQLTPSLYTQCIQGRLRAITKQNIRKLKLMLMDSIKLPTKII